MNNAFQKFTKRQDVELEVLWSIGWTNERIARWMGRSPKAIKARRRALKLPPRSNEDRGGRFRKEAAE